jgi:3-phosphoshikimate 1-carboxyvinyltransferase
MRIRPVEKLSGRVRLPGDKSVSHRAAMLAALAQGRTRIEGFSSSADCASTIGCLSALGAAFNVDGSTVIVEGTGREGLRPAAGVLDCGNSGSTMRMLSGVLAGQKFVSTLSGDESLCSRPMQRVITPLERMGAVISAQNGRAPLRILGRSPLEAISYETPVASAQVKSCVLLAGLFAAGRTEVVERHGPTRDHTERMLEWLGVELETRELDGSPVIALNGPAHLSARDISVPGDISSAAFFIAAAAMLPGSNLVIENVGLNPTRVQLLTTMRNLGADIRVEDERSESNEPVGDIRIVGRAGLAPTESGGNVLSGSVIAQLIDELPVLGVFGSQVEGGLIVRDAAELRVKESDRIAATVANLRSMGAQVEEYDDGFAVVGPVKLRGGSLRAHGDHRIAMAFSIAALSAEGDSHMEGAESVAVSLPEFYELLASVTQD